MLVNWEPWTPFYLSSSDTCPIDLFLAARDERCLTSAPLEQIRVIEQEMVSGSS